MTTNLKKVLLTTSALLAVSMSVPAYAQVATVTGGDDGDNVTLGNNTLVDDDAGNANDSGVSTGGNFTGGAGVQIEVDDTQSLTIDHNIQSDGTNEAVQVTSGGSSVVISAAGNILDTGAGGGITVVGGVDSTLDINGDVVSLGGNAIDTSASGAGATAITITSTTSAISGDIVLGDADTLTFDGNGTNDFNDDINGTTGTGQSFDVNLGASGNTMTFGGNVTDVEAVSITQGTITLDGNITGATTFTTGDDATVAINGQLASGSVTFGGGTSGTVTGTTADIDTTGNLTVDNASAVFGASAITVGDTLTLTSGSLTSNGAGDIDVTNGITVTDSSFTLNGTTDLDAGGVIALSGTSTMDVNGTVTVTSAGITVGNGSTLDAEAGATFTGGDITVSAGGDVDGTVTIGDASDVSITGTGGADTIDGNFVATTTTGNVMTLDGGAGGLDMTGTINGFETINVQGGNETEFSGTLTAVDDINVSAASTADFTGLTFGVTNDISVVGASTLDLTGATFTGDIDLDAGAITTSAATNIVGEVDVDTTNAVSLGTDFDLGTGDATLTFSGNATGTASLAVNIDGGAGTDTLNISNTANNLIINGAIDNFDVVNVNGGGSTLLNGDLTNLADINVTNGSTATLGDAGDVLTGTTTLDVDGTSTLDVTGLTTVGAGTTTIASGGTLTTDATTTFDGDLNFALDGTDNFTGAATVNISAGDNDVTMTGVSTTLDEVFASGGGGSDFIVNLTAGETLTLGGVGGITANALSNFDSLVLTSGSLNYTGGGGLGATAIIMGNDTTLTVAQATYAGSGITGSAGVNTVNIDGGSFDFGTTDLAGGADVVDIDDTSTTSIDGTLGTGAGADSVDIADGVEIATTFSLETGADADTVTIGAVDAAYDGSLDTGTEADILNLNGTTVNTVGTFTLGDGDDTINTTGTTTIAGTTTVAGGAGTDTINILSGTLATSGTSTLDVEDVAFTAGSTFNYGSTATYSGTVTGSAGVDTLDIDAGTFGGAIALNGGTDVVTLNGATFNSTFDAGDDETITVDGGTVTFNDDVLNVGDIDVNNGSTLVMNIGLGDTYAGSISTDANDATVTLTTGNYSGNIDLTGGNDELDVDGVSTFTGDITLDGTDNLDVNTTGAVAFDAITGTAGTTADFGTNAVVSLNDDVTIGTLTGNAAASLATFAVTSDADYTTLTLIGSGGDDLVEGTATTITLNLIDEAQIEQGDVFTFISDAGAGNLAGTFTLDAATTNQFLTFTEDTTTADVYAVEASYSSSGVYTASNTTTDHNNLIAVTDAILQAAPGNTEIDAEKAAFNATTTAAQAEAIAVKLLPTLDDGFIVAGIEVAAETQSMIDGRLASLRTSGDAESGMAAGYGAEGVRFWGQAFGAMGDQDDRDGVYGYESNTYGGAFGADTTQLHDDMTVGLAFAYGKTDIDSNSVNDTETDIDTYQVTLYGDYDFGEGMFVSGNVGYAMNQIDQTRKNVGVGNATATADYDSHQFMAGVAAGRSYEIGYEAAGGMILTPMVSADFVHVNIDEYDETGAGGVSLNNVDTDDVQSLDLGVAVKAEWDYETTSGNVKPSVHAGYKYDVINDQVERTASFAGGGAAFKTEGYEASESTFNVGAGLTFEATSNWDFTAAYDFTAREDYTGHTGYVRAAYKF